MFRYMQGSGLDRTALMGLNGKYEWSVGLIRRHTCKALN